jgi:hypothetical protein
LGDYDQETIRVDFLSETLMSVVEIGSTFCGGAHPNNHYDPFTLDLIRGEYLDWNRLFKAFVRGDHGFRKLSPEMKALIEQIPEHPEWMKEEWREEEERCALDSIFNDYLALHFDKPGHLALTVSGIGNAGNVCLGAHEEVPFSDLRALLKPEARRYFPELRGK